MRIEAGIGMEQARERDDHQAGAGEEHERDGEFADDENFAKTRANRGCAGAADTFLERFDEIDARGVERGCSAEESASEKRDEKSKREGRSVEMNVCGARQIDGRERN